MNNALISVIIPVYNGEKYFVEAIESVLAQNYRPIEIVIVDDGSTDNTAQIAQQLVARHSFIRYFYQENQGLAASRNQGVSLSQAEWIAFIDSDDIWVQDKLSAQMQVILRNPNTEMVSGKVRQFISPEIPDKEHAQYHFHKDDVQTNMMGAALLKKSVFDKYGFFNPLFRIGQDMDWVLKAMEKGLMIEPLNKLVFYRRLHPGNLGRNRADENYKTRFKILKQIINQRRRQE
jgi:glycosyltransferase involved in cell wall biosynthesis